METLADNMFAKIGIDVAERWKEVEIRQDLVSEYNKLHSDVCKELTKAIRFHFNGYNYSYYHDQKCSEAHDYDVKNLVDMCVLFRKGEDLYKIIENDVNYHVKNNILPKMRCVEEQNFFAVLADSWNRYEATLNKLSSLLFCFDQWAKDHFDEATMEIGIKYYRNEFLLQEEIVHLFNISLTVLMGTPIHASVSGEFTDMSFLKPVCNMLIQLNYDKDPKIIELQENFKKLLYVK